MVPILPVPLEITVLLFTTTPVESSNKTCKLALCAKPPPPTFTELYVIPEFRTARTPLAKTFLDNPKEIKIKNTTNIRRVQKFFINIFMID